MRRVEPPLALAVLLAFKMGSPLCGAVGRAAAALARVLAPGLPGGGDVGDAVGGTDGAVAAQGGGGGRRGVPGKVGCR